jgi:hypothetical protein
MAVTGHTHIGMFWLAASSLKAGYIYFGFPGPLESPIITPTMAWDKLEDMSIGSILEALGIIIDISKMEILTPLCRLVRLQDILQRHWNRKQKTFTARGVAQLIGNLLCCLQGYNWLKMLLFNFQTALRQALRQTTCRLIHSTHYFKAILAKMTQVGLKVDGGSKDAKLLGLRSKHAHLLWRCEV